jgi:hypothetical protein
MSPHGNNVYAKITDALDNLDYSRVITGRKERTIDLPSNTYVAKFDDDFEHQTEVVEFVKVELERIFRLYSVSGKYFISAGKSWAWQIGSL